MSTNRSANRAERPSFDEEFVITVQVRKKSYCIPIGCGETLEFCGDDARFIFELLTGSISEDHAQDRYFEMFEREQESLGELCSCTEFKEVYRLRSVRGAHKVSY